MRIVVIMQGFYYGGATIATFNFLKLLRNESDIDLMVITGDKCDVRFREELATLNVETREVPLKFINLYPLLNLNYVRRIIESTDIIWIPDAHIECLNALEARKISKACIIGHLHSYAMICPRWDMCYGFEKACPTGCNLMNYVRCSIQRGIRYSVGIAELREPRLRPKQLRKIFYVALGACRAFKSLSLWQYLRWPLRRVNVIDAFDGFIACSNALRKIYLRLFPQIATKHFEVIYDPVLIDENILQKSLHHKQGNVITLMYASGSALIKGSHILLSAFQLLLDEGFNARVRMVNVKGSWVEKMLDKPKLKGHCEVYGWLPLKDLLNIYSTSDIVVMPSIWPEPFGLVALEANMYGIPVVASATGGLSEIVQHNVTGILVKPNDPRELVKGIKQAVHLNISRRRIHELTAKKFNAKRSASKLLTFFTKIMRLRGLI